MGLNWSFKFKSVEEKKEWFQHANDRKRTLAGLVRELMEFDMAGFNPFENNSNKNEELIELLSKKIKLLEENLSEKIKVGFNAFLLHQQYSNVDFSPGLEKFVLATLNHPMRISEIQELTKMELGLLYVILSNLVEKGVIELNWERQIYRKLKE